MSFPVKYSVPLTHRLQSKDVVDGYEAEWYTEGVVEITLDGDVVRDEYATTLAKASQWVADQEFEEEEGDDQRI